MNSPLFRLSIACLALLGAAHCSEADPPADRTSSAGAAGQGGSAGIAGAAGQAGQAGQAGAPDGPIEVTPAMFTAEGIDLDAIDEGEAIPLTLPPQGGHVLWIGAYITNLRSDTIELRARLRDPDTSELVAEESRTVVVRPVEGKPGLFQPDIRTVSQVTHVPVCPDYFAKPIAETPYKLEVTVRELYVEPQRTAIGTRTVVPSCAILPEDARPICTCECEANYSLGKCKGVPLPSMPE